MRKMQKLEQLRQRLDTIDPYDGNNTALDSALRDMAIIVKHYGHEDIPTSVINEAKKQLTEPTDDILEAAALIMHLSDSLQATFAVLSFDALLPFILTYGEIIEIPADSNTRLEDLQVAALLMMSLFEPALDNTDPAVFIHNAPWEPNPLEKPDHRFYPPLEAGPAHDYGDNE